MSNQILVKNIKTGKETMLAEAGAKNLIAMHPDTFEQVKSEKPKATGEAPKETKTRTRKKKSDTND